MIKVIEIMRRAELSFFYEFTFAKLLAIKEIFGKDVFANHVILHLVGEATKIEKIMF